MGVRWSKDETNAAVRAGSGHIGSADTGGKASQIESPQQQTEQGDKIQCTRYSDQVGDIEREGDRVDASPLLA